MIQFSGKTVFSGVAFAKAFLYLKADLAVDATPASDSGVELEAFRAAIKTADGQLEEIYKKTLREIGEEEARIIDVQRMMLVDGDFLEAVEAVITGEHGNAAYAVDKTGRQFYELFAGLDDPYMKARAPDIADISRRLTAVLLNKRTDFTLGEASVIIADDLTPSDTLSLDKKYIAAFVTRGGSTNSHTAILARILKIPSIVQADIPLDKKFNALDAAVDGHEGIIYLEPDKNVKERLKERARKDKAEADSLESVRGLPTVTKSGKKVELAANIGSVEDLKAVFEGDAEGIGLFRSEFLFLGRNSAPAEDEQFEAYKAAALALGGKRVVIRTLDIGADKQAAYLGCEAEENPALGLRAIRLCFRMPQLFVTQLRALYRAAAFGKIAVMFPMIASLWELRRCKEIAAEAKNSLIKEGITTGEIELGIMIETPAAALCAGELAAEADFFSVGTNDLTQYTLAIDRQSAKLDKFLDTHHPALLKLLKMIVESAHRAHIWAGICGELAADKEMTARFIEWGYDELSVSPAFILDMRKRIREME
ncbi:MAG: phosphoenolpyruvate--protein phosphotransferase [Treponema sp.]|jgi:phosphotransferase system enzyme I (PtsI)|nr:phosphoenolpyruvate--protein phosphotransferase [Treponema sp.]